MKELLNPKEIVLKNMMMMYVQEKKQSINNVLYTVTTSLSDFHAFGSASEILSEKKNDIMERLDEINKLLDDCTVLIESNELVEVKSMLDTLIHKYDEMTKCFAELTDIMIQNKPC